jgi:hypothetical protein
MPIIREVQKAGARGTSRTRSTLAVFLRRAVAGGSQRPSAMCWRAVRSAYAAQAQPHTTTARPTPTYAEWKARAAALTEQHGSTPVWVATE